MSLLFNDEPDYEGGIAVGGISVGGYTLGGANELMGGATQALMKEIHVADKKLIKRGLTKAKRRSLLNKGISSTSPTIKKVAEEHGITYAKAKSGILNRYFQLLEEKKLSKSGDKGFQLYSGKETKAATKAAIKAEKAVEKAVKKPLTKASKKHVDAVKRLARTKGLNAEDKKQLFKLLALLGSGFWGDIFDGIKQVASKAVDIAPALLPLVL